MFVMMRVRNQEFVNSARFWNMTSALTRPASAVETITGLLGLIGLMGATVATRPLAETDPAMAVLVICAMTALPMVLVDLLLHRVHRRESAGLRPLSWRDTIRMVDLGRSGMKLLGLAATVLALWLLYATLPEYQSSFYRPFYQAVGLVLPWLGLLAVPYVVLLDARMAEPRDGYWMAGAAVLGRWRDIDRALLGQHVRGWLVKGFFLPLMFVYMSRQVQGMSDPGALRVTFMAVFDQLYQWIFLIDLSFALIGYILTVRLIDSHIRSTDPTWFGWTVGLICYQPFWDGISARYFAYEDSLKWTGWLAPWPVLQTLWGCAILALLLVYAWGTLAFGYRFSNLTHRGILTHGPFRWTKHPAYITKNLSWWLISVPFISQAGPAEALRHCALLAGVNLIYFLRARSEERHLSADPVYVAYALWINEHGLFRRLSRLVPALRYRPPGLATAA